MSTTSQLCTFHIGDMYLGVPVEHVQEVLRYHPLTRVPLAAPSVSGLINLRGQIVTAIDLRERFRLPKRPAGCEPMNVVIRSDDGVVSLLVDGIGDVREPSPDSFEPSPSTLREPARALVRGAYKLEDRLLLTLDVQAAVDVQQETLSHRS